MSTSASHGAMRPPFSPSSMGISSSVSLRGIRTSRRREPWIGGKAITDNFFKKAGAEWQDWAFHIDAVVETADTIVVEGRYAARLQAHRSRARCPGMPRLAIQERSDRELSPVCRHRARTGRHGRPARALPRSAACESRPTRRMSSYVAGCPSFAASRSRPKWSPNTDSVCRAQTQWPLRRIQVDVSAASIVTGLPSTVSFSRTL